MIKPLFFLSLLATGLSLTPLITPGYFSVEATLETEPSPYPGDSIDDIAIWQHPNEPAMSLVIATLKASNQMPRKPAGLLVYDMEGKQRQFLSGGSPNNVDLRYGFEWQGESVPLIAAGHWWSNDVSLYTIDASRRWLRELTREPIPTGLDQPRGLCMYKNDGNFYYVVISKAGDVEQYLVQQRPELTAKLVRAFSVGSNAEGCVADDSHGALYIAEETVGIWRYSAAPGDDRRKLVDRVKWRGPLKADIEGLTLYQRGSEDGWLLASSQGNDLIVVYDRSRNRYVGSFRIAGGAVDEVTYTDGIDAAHLDLGPRFPAGVFVAHDDRNERDDRPRNQNFKLVDWRSIAEHLDALADKE